MARRSDCLQRLFVRPDCRPTRPVGGSQCHFQRVYVGYQKFLPWVAKAYIASGESFERLGKKQEATNTYRELLRNEKLASFSEAAEARKRLEALGQGS